MRCIREEPAFGEGLHAEKGNGAIRATSMMARGTVRRGLTHEWGIRHFLVKLPQFLQRERLISQHPRIRGLLIGPTQPLQSLLRQGFGRPS